MTDAELSRVLIPSPRQCRAERGEYSVGPETRILVRGELAGAGFVGRRLADLVRDEFQVEINVAAEGSAEFELILGDARAAGDTAVPRPREAEGYSLVCRPGSARVLAADRVGLLHGAMTLWQSMARIEGKVTIPACTIEDWPRYRWRGFMIDSGRAPNSLAQIKRIIRLCSAFKLNMLVFREGDDELNAVRYRTNPLGSENPCALTMDEVAEMIRYAAEYGISVVPEIESLGHAGARRVHYPHLIQGGIQTNYPGIGVHTRKSNFDVANPQSYEVLRSIYSEWLQVLSSPLIHLGMDEVRLPMEVQAQHLARLLPMLDEVAAEHGKQVTPIVWADCPRTPAGYEDRVIRCPWVYGDAGEIDLDDQRIAERLGMAELSAAGCCQPVLMAGGSGSLHQPYTKGDAVLSNYNLASWARWGDERPNHMGILAVQWHGNMLDDWLVDFAGTGDVGWNPASGASTVRAASQRVNQCRELLQRLRDFSHPAANEVDRPAWDGIWLPEKRWEAEVSPRPNR